MDKKIKLRVPRKVLVRGVWYKISRPKKLVADGETIDGLIDFDGKLIEVRFRCPNPYKIYLHELAHAMLWESGVRSLEEPMEEVIIELFVDFVWHFIFFREVS